MTLHWNFLPNEIKEVIYEFYDEQTRIEMCKYYNSIILGNLLIKTEDLLETRYEIDDFCHKIRHNSYWNII
jgi:hypothetical protein